MLKKGGRGEKDIQHVIKLCYPFCAVLEAVGPFERLNSDKVWFPFLRNSLLVCKRTRGWRVANRDVFRILLNRQGKFFLLCTKVTLLIFFLKETVFQEEATSQNFKKD